MPIYQFTCDICGHELEQIVKMGQDTFDCPKCFETFKDMGGQKMKKVLSVPSPMQWGCRKGF